MSNADWWAKQLGVTPAAKPADIPMPPSQQPMTKYEPPKPQQPSVRLQSASQVETCPDCGSTNYMSVNKSAPRCYECGYPVQQSGSKFGALTGARVEGTVKQSLGNDTTNNWNPQGVIGRIND